MGRDVKRPLIFECVGVPGVIQSLAEAAPRGARIVVAGVLHGNEPTTWSRCSSSSRRSSYAYLMLGLSARAESAASPARNHLADGTTRYHEIITGVVGLDETPDAFVRLQTDKSQIKILVAPGR